jgi:hypothetical protein
MRPAGLVSALALVAGLAAGAGCGSSGTIAPGDAQQLRDGLARVRSAIAAGHCAAAGTTVATLRSQARSLDVPASLRRNLAEGLDKLDTAAATECQTAAKPKTTPTETITTATVTIPATEPTATTAPPTTETTPTTTIPPTTSTPTTEPPTGGVSPGDGQGTGGGGENK